MSNLAKKYQAINLGQGFPNFDCHPELRDLVIKHLQDKKNQYCPMQGLLRLREIIAQKIFSLYNHQINPIDEITITAGATQAIFTAILDNVNPGDEVIIIEPAYDCYRPTIEIAKGIVVPYKLEGPDYKINWEIFGELISLKTKMIILNNPHNPTGSILREEDLGHLELLVRDKDLIILSDEVYEHLVYDDQKHQSIFTKPELANKALAVFSFGKTFHVTGWKIGYIVGPDRLMKGFRKIHQWNVFSVNSFLQYALAEYLENPSSYLQLSSFYQQKRDYLAQHLSTSHFKDLSCTGTFFQLYDYSQISDMLDIDFAQLLVREYGVATIPLTPFMSVNNPDKVIRLCFAKTEKVLSEAAEKLCLIKEI